MPNNNASRYGRAQKVSHSRSNIKTRELTRFNIVLSRNCGLEPASGLKGVDDDVLGSPPKISEVRQTIGPCTLNTGPTRLKSRAQS